MQTRPDNVTVCECVLSSAGDERADEVQVTVISIPGMVCAVIGGCWSLAYFPVRSLCEFYLASLNECTKARLPGVGPRGSFAEFVEWVLRRQRPFNHHQRVNRRRYFMSPPQTEKACLPRWMSQEQGQGRMVTSPPEPASSHKSDQVREPATSIIDEEVLVELEGWEESPTRNSTVVDEIHLFSGKYYEELKDILEEDLVDFCGEVFPSPPVSPASSDSPTSLVSPEFSPSLPLPPPQSASSSAPSPLMFFSPSISPTCHVELPSVFRPSSPSRTEDPLSPPPASVPPAPPRPVYTSDAPWLFPPSAPPWSAVDLPAPSAPSGSTFLR
ncbi:hypothetical protein DPX16_19214 [Anabarilius grahami]|uniref:Uncharacterized protein n=1 Tax=Anabarilius grahami TaxID=495550 RepID=A0A3N0YZG3_ANAGA|nr:hypothetical protein DPX16_19214 [Anabarilius grahami]